MRVYSPWVNIWNSEDSPGALEWIREGGGRPLAALHLAGAGGGCGVFLCVITLTLDQRVCKCISPVLTACSTRPLNNPAELFGKDSRIYRPRVNVGCGLRLLKAHSLETQRESFISTCTNPLIRNAGELSEMPHITGNMKAHTSQVITGSNPPFCNCLGFRR